MASVGPAIEHRFESAHRHGLERVGFWTVERSLALELGKVSVVAGVQR